MRKSAPAAAAAAATGIWHLALTLARPGCCCLMHLELRTIGSILLTPAAQTAPMQSTLRLALVN
jgi:hypothetical protein